MRTELDRRLRSLDLVEPPDLWPDISSRRPGPSLPEISPRRRVWVIVIALLVAAASSAFLVRAFGRPAPAKPASPPANGEIWSLAGGGEGGSAIYTVDSATGTKSLLWTDGRDPAWPPGKAAPELVGSDYAFSPDGSRVVFEHSVDEGRSGLPSDELFVMNADGSGLRQLTHDGAHDGFPTWSPDGTRVVYTSYRGDRFVAGCLASAECPSDLHVINADGSAETRLTYTPGDESMPSWSPDGTQIVFRSTRDDPAGTLFVMNADGTDARALDTGTTSNYWPRWSPDGRSVAFVAEEENRRFGIYSVPFPNPVGQATLLADTAWDTLSGAVFTWSPDGSEIAFGRRDGADNSQLYLVGADGSGEHRLAELPGWGLAPVAWRPNPIGP